MVRVKSIKKITEHPHPTMRKGKMIINGIEVNVNIPESVWKKGD